MEVQKDVWDNEKKLLQWHPAFFAGIQIELEEEADQLVFEQEHQLGTKPMGIDVLIKKENGKAIKKNIGRIFRKHNIIEYKSPGDYLSVDDFYKVYGYACFYKTDVTCVDEIKAKELTISFISESYPKKLIRHLEQERKLELEKIDDGIYYMTGDQIPIQFIVTRFLSKKENLWLSSLTNHLDGVDIAKELIEAYKDNQENNLYKSMMDVIVRANKEKFLEVKEMCLAIEELMKDELEAKRKEGVKEGMKEGMKEGRRAEKQRVNTLILKLSELGRADEIVKAAADETYQNKLFEEFGL